MIMKMKQLPNSEELSSGIVEENEQKIENLEIGITESDVLPSNCCLAWQLLFMKRGKRE